MPKEVQPFLHKMNKLREGRNGKKVGGTEKEKFEYALGRVPSSYKGSTSIYATVTGQLAGISSCAYKTSGWAVFL